MERILSEPLKLLGVKLDVRNAAIGGAPSFPYGWCLPNFLGADADVVSWDFSMNEAGDSTGGIEAYLRHALQLRNKPMLIVKDTHTAVHRRDLIQRYADLGLTADALVLHSDPAAAPFLALSESSRPPGFQNWREFGSPPNAPGRAPHHPAVAEHEFLGWVLSIHLLGAVEVAAAALWAKGDGMEGMVSEVALLTQESIAKKGGLLPPPLHSHLGGGTKGMSPTPLSRDIIRLLYGYRSADAPAKGGDAWKLKRVHCHTSFDPIVAGSLSDLVIYGAAPSANNKKSFLGALMLPKGRALYNKGWVIDLGEPEKKAKRRLERYGGLGFTDSKAAFYGIKASGPLGLFIPIERENRILAKTDQGEQRVVGDQAAPQEGDGAARWIQSIVVCEVNEKRGDGECDLQEDLSFTVGGVQVETVTRIRAEGVSYLGKDICLTLDTPSGSMVEGRVMAQERAKQSGIDVTNAEEMEDDLKQVGIALEISVTRASVDLKKGPCSLSHVVWQEV